MKHFVKSLAIKIREAIKEEPPKIVEYKSQTVMFSIANDLMKHNIIDAHQFIEMSKEIAELYTTGNESTN